jgi:hypothetical protein
VALRRAPQARMSGIGSTPGVGDAAGEDGDDGRDLGVERLGDPATCFSVMSAVTFSFTPCCGQLLDERQRGLAASS